MASWATNRSEISQDRLDQEEWDPLSKFQKSLGNMTVYSAIPGGKDATDSVLKGPFENLGEVRWSVAITCSERKQRHPSQDRRAERPRQLLTVRLLEAGTCTTASKPE